MPYGSPPRVQFVLSGKFLILLLVALSLLGGGYYWYTAQQQNQKRFQTPPYFVNRESTIIRNCEQCLDIDNLKPQADWRIGSPKKVPAAEQRWFLAVEDPPTPVTVAGVLMLPLHPAYQDDPAFGFDQNRVVLVLYQDLQRKPWIEKPALSAVASQVVQSPPPQPLPIEPVAASEPADVAASETEAPSTGLPDQSPFVGEWKNTDPNTNSLTRLLITTENGGLIVHVWAKCLPVECDWGTGPRVSLPPVADGFLVIWDHKYALHSQRVSMEDDSRLKVSLRTHFTDKSGRHDLEIVSYFTKTPDAP